MIKKTFYGLPQEKRDRIISAIIAEFKRCPAEKISINRIVKTAEISRGSFYQYFDDKVDLIQIITEGFSKIAAENLTNKLISTDGDIFEALLDFFYNTRNFAQLDQNKDICKNIMGTFKVNSDLFANFMKYRFRGKEDFEFISLINVSRFNFKTKTDVQMIVEILMEFVFSALFEVFVVGCEAEEISEKLRRKIEIVKIGAMDTKD